VGTRERCRRTVSLQASGVLWQDARRNTHTLWQPCWASVILPIQCPPPPPLDAFHSLALSLPCTHLHCLSQHPCSLFRPSHYLAQWPASDFAACQRLVTHASPLLQQPLSVPSSLHLLAPHTLPLLQAGTLLPYAALRPPTLEPHFYFALAFAPAIPPPFPRHWGPLPAVGWLPPPTSARPHTALASLGRRRPGAAAAPGQPLPPQALAGT
jgi:hypothetical protein